MAGVLFLLGVGLAFTSTMALDSYNENLELKNKIKELEEKNIKVDDKIG